MQVCPHCGLESRTSDRYCLHCGQILDAQGGSHDVEPSLAPGSRPDVARAPLGKRASAAGVRNPPPALTPRNAALARLTLKAREGEQSSAREYPLDGRDIVIGRAPSCDVVLPSDQLASRRHTLLEFDGVRYTIRDLGSSNGTYVNGEEIHQTIALNDGDTIAVGEHELLFSRAPARTTDGFPIPVPPPWPPAFTSAVGQPAGPTQKQPAVSSARTDIPPGGQSAAPRPATGGPASAGDNGAIEQLHKMLVDASAGMVRRAEEAERQVAELRAALADVERAADGAMDALAGDALPSRGTRDESTMAAAAQQRLSELVRVARTAAEHPRHLDHISALAEHAGDIASALEAAADLARALGSMSERLSALSAEPEEAVD